MNGTQVPGKEAVRATSSLPHASGLSETLLYQLACEECTRRGVACGGVWRFHSQHGRYILQCRTCRLKKRACPFRKFEDDYERQMGPKRREGASRGKKRRRASTPISISDSDSEGGYQEKTQVAGPSSRPEKKFKVDDADGWDKLRDTLLAARKKKVEIGTIAEIELAKLNNVIEEAQRDLKKGK